MLTPKRVVLRMVLISFTQLTIENDDVRYEYSSTDLLSRKDIETISIRDVSAYPRVDMTFTAIKFATFLQELKFKLDSTIEFIAMDGFTAPLEPSLLLNTSIDKSIAYLAIEDPDNKWPAHRSGEGTAGPFYFTLDQSRTIRYWQRRMAV